MNFTLFVRKCYKNHEHEPQIDGTWEEIKNKSEAEALL